MIGAVKNVVLTVLALTGIYADIFWIGTLEVEIFKNLVDGRVFRMHPICSDSFAVTKLDPRVIAAIVISNGDPEADCGNHKTKVNYCSFTHNSWRTPCHRVMKVDLRISIKEYRRNRSARRLS